MEQKNNSFDKKEFRQFDEQPVRRHSRFLAVMFGFVPGAGHMYLGKMNRGLTLMALCFGMIALGVIFTPVFLLLPLVWFYAFFDCLNLSALPQAKLDAMPDELGFGSCTNTYACEAECPKLIKRQNISRLNRQWIGALFGRDRKE